MARVLLVAALLLQQGRPGVTVFPPPVPLPVSSSQDCVSASHAHVLADCRIMLVRIEQVIPCGFYCSDLENGTICAQPVLNGGFEQHGEAMRVARGNYIDQSGRAVTVYGSFAAIPPKRGLHALIFICSYCHAGFVIKPM